MRCKFFVLIIGHWFLLIWTKTSFLSNIKAWCSYFLIIFVWIIPSKSSWDIKHRSLEWLWSQMEWATFHQILLATQNQNLTFHMGCTKTYSVVYTNFNILDTYMKTHKWNYWNDLRLLMPWTLTFFAFKSLPSALLLQIIVQYKTKEG